SHARERDLRPWAPRDIRIARPRRGRRVPRRAGGRARRRGPGASDPARACVARRRPAPGIARLMALIALLATPLLAAGILALTRERLAAFVHAVGTLVTTALVVVVGVTVVEGRTLVALDGFLRADALSAWMVALIGVVSALAALEAPRYARGAGRRFYP